MTGFGAGLLVGALIVAFGVALFSLRSNPRDRTWATRAEQRLALGLDAIPQGVVIRDGSGRVVFQNAAARRFSTAQYGHALVEAAIDAQLSQATAGSPGAETVELAGPPRRILVITARSLVLDSGDLGAVAVIDDVTERRRLEAVRRDFVANISHELKTPVGAVALLAETLVDEEDRTVASRLAARLLTEAHRVGRTIEDLLELSSIEVEETPVREPVSVQSVLSSAVERIRPAADQRGISVALEEPEQDLNVLADRRQLVSAVFNLLDNAVKFSDDGSTVTTRAVIHDQGVDLVVEDRGVGIPARDLERVFERFYRIDQARSRQTGGTGLGLAIVRHVVNNHAGEVLVTSREGAGSTFVVRIPSALNDTPDDQLSSQP